ncbi:hypothetical protein DMENIID0001_112640 [Sergentomyia squamirostris]
MPGSKLVFEASTAPQFTSFTNSRVLFTNTAARPLNSHSAPDRVQGDNKPTELYLGHVEVPHWISHTKHFHATPNARNARSLREQRRANSQARGVMGRQRTSIRTKDNTSSTLLSIRYTVIYL